MSPAYEALRRSIYEYRPSSPCDFDVVLSEFFLGAGHDPAGNYPDDWVQILHNAVQEIGWEVGRHERAEYDYFVPKAADFMGAAVAHYINFHLIEGWYDAPYNQE